MPPSREYLKRITVENRILLLLHDHRSRKDDYSVPEVMSQGGMSRELDVRQNNISRTLQELASKDLVASRSSHVTGKQRRRKVYFLTEKGLKQADELISGLGTKYVLVRTKKGDIEEWTFDRFVNHLSRQMSRKFTVYETVTYHLDGNEADLSIDTSIDAPETISISLPLIGEFYGRKEELTVLEEFMTMKGPAMMLVLGIAGQGKTTLVSHFLKDHFVTRFHWIPCNRWMRPLNFLIECSVPLKLLSAGSLSKYLKSTSSPDPGAGAVELVKDLTSSSMVLVLDDAHRMSQEMSDFMRVLKETQVSMRADTKILLMSRIRPQFLSRTEVLVEERMMELELEGLDRGSVASLLRDIDVPDEEHEMIYSLTNGHPLALSLLKASPDIDPGDLRTSLDRFLDEEILSSLGKEESSVLELASVLEDPVKMDCFTSLPDVGIETVTSLRNRMLLRDYSDGTMDLHDAIKDTVRSSLPPEKLDLYMRTALEYYSKRSRDRDLLNYLNLCRELGRFDDTVNILTDYGEYLLGKGYPIVLESLWEIMDKELDRSTRIKLLILKSEADRLGGDGDGSKGSLREAALLCEDLYQSDEPEGMVMMSRILSRMAEIHLDEGVDEDGMETYRKSLKLVRKAGIPQEEGKILSNMGTAYMGLEEYDLALDHLERSLNIYEGLDDPRGANICRLNIGEVYQRKGDLSLALKSYLETIKNSSREGLDRIQYQALFRTGKLYMMVMQPMDAFGYLRSALSGYISIGEVDYAEKVLVHFVSSSIKSKKVEDGIRSLKRNRRTLTRYGRFKTLFTGRGRNIGTENFLEWIDLYLRIMDTDDHDYHIQVLDMLSSLDRKGALSVLRELAYCISPDFMGPDTAFLNSLIENNRSNSNILIESCIMLAKTHDTGSDDWRSDLRRAMKIAKERKLTDQMDRIRSILGRERHQLR